MRRRDGAICPAPCGHRHGRQSSARARPCGAVAAATLFDRLAGLDVFIGTIVGFDVVGVAPGGLVDRLDVITVVLGQRLIDGFGRIATRRAALPGAVAIAVAVEVGVADVRTRIVPRAVMRL